MKLAGDVQVYGNVGTHRGLRVERHHGAAQHAPACPGADSPLGHGQARTGETSVRVIRRARAPSGCTSMGTQVGGAWTSSKCSAARSISSRSPSALTTPMWPMPSARRTAGDTRWLIDLKDKDNPSSCFSHPLVDVTHPVLARDSRFIGAGTITAIMMYYADSDIDAVMRGFELNPAIQCDRRVLARREALPGPFHERHRCVEILVVERRDASGKESVHLPCSRHVNLARCGPRSPTQRADMPGLSLDVTGSSRDAPAVDIQRRTHCARP